MNDQRDAGAAAGPDRRWRVLVVGCGSIGQRHIGNLRRLGVENVLGVEPRGDRRRLLSATHGVDSRSSVEEAWDWSPDVVLVCTPTSLHVETALEAARRGCHLFIEKPLSHTWEGVERLVSLVACNLRFHPGLRTVKRLLDEGAVGTVVACRVEFGHYLPDWHPGEDYRRSYSARRDLGGGVILDAIHEIDYIGWLLGEVHEVVCFTGRRSHLEIETEDTAALLLRFESGAIGEIHLDYVQRAYSRTCQVIGDEGTVRWDYIEGSVRYYSSGDRQWQVYDTGSDWTPDAMYVDELRHFLHCLAGDEQPVQDVAGGARALEVALAAKESATSGRRSGEHAHG